MIERSEWLKQMRETTVARYDLWSSVFFFETDEDASNSRVEATVRYLEDFLRRIHSNSRVLTAGCGEGRYDGMLLHAGHSVVGIDVSEGLLSHAKKLYPAIRYVKMALNEMSFESEFEGAICIETLEHVFPEEWPIILRGFHKALKPGGLLYFTVDTASDEELKRSYERATAQGLPVVFGEVAEDVEEASAKVIAAGGDVPDEVSDRSVYHYYPGLERVQKWLHQEQFEIETQGTAKYSWGSDNAYEATYEHFVVRKR